MCKQYSYDSPLMSNNSKFPLMTVKHKHVSKDLCGGVLADQFPALYSYAFLWDPLGGGG